MRPATSSLIIICPYLFENAEGPTVTVNAERYKVTLESFLRNVLHTHQVHFLRFRQDGGTAHTAQISVLVFRAIFSVTFVSLFDDITLPSHSPDLTVPVTKKCLVQTVTIQRIPIDIECTLLVLIKFFYFFKILLHLKTR